MIQKTHFAKRWENTGKKNLIIIFYGISSFVCYLSYALEVMTNFIEIIRILIIQPGWFSDTFLNMKMEEADAVRDTLEETLAEALIDADTIEIVHEDMLYECMMHFRHFVNAVDVKYKTYEEFMENKENITRSLYHEIYTIFH